MLVNWELERPQILEGLTKCVKGILSFYGERSETQVLLTDLEKIVRWLGPMIIKVDSPT
jgi:hypothetical protein